jgi:2-amino-4-hydroxy-6-hydroxymethyldihydropteridine diphosphokinase
MPPRPGATSSRPAFINACIEIETSLDPHALLFTLHKIEAKFGRDRANETALGTAHARPRSDRL